MAGSGSFVRDPRGEFLERCDDLIDRATELPERAEDFASRVIMRLEGMREWSATRAGYTRKMDEALDAIEESIERWE